MGIPSQTLDSIRIRTRAFFRGAFSGLPMGLKTFLGQSSEALAINAWGLQKSAEDLALDIVPSAQSSAGSLAQWAFDFGLPNGAGGYGLLAATTASGGLATLTGTKATVFADGTIATGPDGTTQIKVSGTVTIAGSAPGSGSVTGHFVAVTAGTVGNLPVGSVCTWQSAPAGSDPTFTLTSPLTGAVDVETSAAVFQRLLLRLQVPPRGGVSGDYRVWAQEVAGIVGVFIYPQRSGTGNIDIVVTVGGSGTGRVPSGTLVTSVASTIAPLRPVAVNAINVLAPHTTSGHLIRVRVAPNGSANAFDWGAESPGTAYAVHSTGYSAGPPATLKIVGIAPASLKLAIDNYKASVGTKPRLQVLSTGSVINIPIGVVDRDNDSGGNTTLTLDTVPTGWVVPADGDTIYPYGPVVGTIASGLLAYVDALGTSRASGFADAFTFWGDTISVNQLVRVAEDAVDAAGNALITEVPTGGATVDGGVLDIVAADTLAAAPELLFASHIAVTQ